MLDRAHRRRRGSCDSDRPARRRCAIQIGNWWLTITTSPLVDRRPGVLDRGQHAVGDRPERLAPARLPRVHEQTPVADVAKRAARGRACACPRSGWSGSMTRSSRVGSSPNAAATGAAVCWVRCSGDAISAATGRSRATRSRRPPPPSGGRGRSGRSPGGGRRARPGGCPPRHGARDGSARPARVPV